MVTECMSDMKQGGLDDDRNENEMEFGSMSMSAR